MRSLVLRAGTVAGVVAVLALPTAVARAATTTVPTGTAATSAPSTGRIVSGDALAAAVAVSAPGRTSATGPVVQRRPLGTGTSSTGDAAVAS